MQQIPPGKLPIPSENYCSRPLVDFWDAGDILTTPEAPMFGKPSILEYSPAKFDEILSNFAGIFGDFGLGGASKPRLHRKLVR